MSKRVWVVLSVISDALLINIAIILAFLVRFSGKLPTFNFRAYTSLAIFITLIQSVALYIYDLYAPEKTQSGWEIFFSVVKASTLGVLLIVFLTYFYRFFSFPRTVFVLSWLLLIVILAGWRLLATKVLKIKFPVQKILLVGTGEATQVILEELKSRAQWGYKVVGVADRNADRVGEKLDGVEIVGDIYRIPELVRELGVNRVIVTTPMRHRELLEELAKSKEADVKVEVVPALYEIFIGRVDYNLISDIPLMELTSRTVPGWIHLSKRLIDIVLALVLIVITLPVMLIAVPLVKLTSRGPLLYKQERVGKDEKIFNIYKLRTMIAEAEKKTGPTLAEEEDKRLTKVGGFLRRYRIDELPQLFNILSGQMSFVGPRPERPYFVAQHKKEIPGYAERFRIKPGVTGLAQISGTYATTAQNKLKYDLIYAYHQSILLDIEILLHTTKVVLTGRGAR